MFCEAASEAFMFNECTTNLVLFRFQAAVCSMKQLIEYHKDLQVELYHSALVFVGSEIFCNHRGTQRASMDLARKWKGARSSFDGFV